MYTGSYDTPVRDLKTYRLRLEELARLGFRSVGLAIDWDEHPRDLPEEEKVAIDELVKAGGLEIRLHPDLAQVHRRAQEENLDLLTCARREMAPIIEWALRLGAFSICCDSIRPLFEETVEVFRLMIDMTRGTGLKFGVENSQRGVINSPDKMNEAVERVDDPRMGLLVDIGHVNTTIANQWVSCQSPEEFLAGLRAPIWDTHVHNNTGWTDGHLTLRDPTGTLDLSAVVRGLHGLGFEGPLNMECKRGDRSLREIEEIVTEDKIFLEGLIREVAT